jgi:hypothetical protein
MKTALKWILGILIGLVLVAAVAAAGYFIFARWSIAGAVMRPRVFVPFEGRRNLPLEPFQMMPYQRYGGFFPLRLIGSALFCLGFLAVIVLAVVALVRVLRQPRMAAAAPVSTPVAAPIPMPEKPQAPAATRNCSNCGKPVQDDWSHCPYCGNTLTAA